MYTTVIPKDGWRRITFYDPVVMIESETSRPDRSLKGTPTSHLKKCAGRRTCKCVCVCIGGSTDFTAHSLILHGVKINNEYVKLTNPWNTSLEWWRHTQEECVKGEYFFFNKPFGKWETKRSLRNLCVGAPGWPEECAGKITHLAKPHRGRSLHTPN